MRILEYIHAFGGTLVVKTCSNNVFTSTFENQISHEARIIVTVTGTNKAVSRTVRVCGVVDKNEQLHREIPCELPLTSRVIEDKVLETLRKWFKLSGEHLITVNIDGKLFDHTTPLSYTLDQGMFNSLELF